MRIQQKNYIIFNVLNYQTCSYFDPEASYRDGGMIFSRSLR
jgi:hypothetical protein